MLVEVFSDCVSMVRDAPKVNLKFDADRLLGELLLTEREAFWIYSLHFSKQETKWHKDTRRRWKSPQR
jgi:hypothetical protein